MVVVVFYVVWLLGYFDAFAFLSACYIELVLADEHGGLKWAETVLDRRNATREREKLLWASFVIPVSDLDQPCTLVMKAPSEAPDSIGFS